MGRVQIAFDTQTRRRVALKTIHPRNAGIKNLEFRFRRESRALAAIGRGAPILYDSGTDPEPYFTMEIVEGVTLAATLKHGKIEPHRALGLAIDLAEILQAAHEVGVVHRDVKPDNIVIGHGDRVRLLDFGACLLLPRFHQRHLIFPATPAEERYATGALEAVGTPGYTAPEVLAMDGGASPRSDIYSVCAVLYEMLTGRPLVDRATTRTHAIEPGEFAAALGPVADLLRRGTAREPADRLSSMADLARSLEILRAGLVHAGQRRQRAWVAGIAAGCTAAVAGLLAVALRVSPVPVASLAVPGAVAAMPAADDVSPPATSTPAVLEPAAADAAPPAMPEPPANSTATGVPASPQPAVGTPTSPAAVALTEAVVAARLATRAARLRAQCDAPWLVLDLTVQRGRATLAAINGMPFNELDPLHACVRAQLRGLDFPRAEQLAKFSLPIDLSPKDPR